MIILNNSLQFNFNCMEILKQKSFCKNYQNYFLRRTSQKIDKYENDEKFNKKILIFNF